MAASLLAANLLTWCQALAAFSSSPALIAQSLGLRHGPGRRSH